MNTFKVLTVASIMITVFWDVMQRFSTQVPVFSQNQLPASPGYSSTLGTETAGSSKTLASIFIKLHNVTCQKPVLLM